MAATILDGKRSDPIHIKPSHKGRLHRALGIKEGEPISRARLEAAKARTKDPALLREIQFALNARGWGK